MYHPFAFIVSFIVASMFLPAVCGAGLFLSNNSVDPSFSQAKNTEATQYSNIYAPGITLANAPENRGTSIHPTKLLQGRGPPVNALYELEIRIPVLGQQRFQLRIVSETIAELVIDGILKINDQIMYRVEPTTGDLSFNLSDNTRGILKRFRTSLKQATYCWKTDTPSIKVKPPLPTSINLRLKRMNFH